MDAVDTCLVDLEKAANRRRIGIAFRAARPDERSEWFLDCPHRWIVRLLCGGRVASFGWGSYSAGNRPRLAVMLFTVLDMYLSLPRDFSRCSCCDEPRPPDVQRWLRAHCTRVRANAVKLRRVIGAETFDELSSVVSALLDSEEGK